MRFQPMGISDDVHRLDSGDDEPARLREPGACGVAEVCAEALLTVGSTP